MASRPLLPLAAADQAYRAVSDRASSTEYGSVASHAAPPAGDAPTSSVYEGAQLRKGFNAFMAVAFVLTSVSIVPSISTTFTFGLQNSGPFWLIWTWVLASTLTCLVACSLGEICSTYSNSVYFWTGQLASPEWAPVVSYVCGWINFSAWVFGGGAMANNCAQIVQAMSLINGGPAFSTAALVALSCALMASWAAINLFRIDQLGFVNNAAAVFQIAATFATLIVALALTHSYASADFLWTPNRNFPGGAHESVVFPVMSGMLFSLFALSGFDSGSQSSEETQDAATAAPRGMIRGCVISAIVGFAYSLGLLFLCADVNSVLPPSAGGSGVTNQAMVNIFFQSSGRVGGLILSALLFTSVYFGGQTTLTVSSRIAFSLARDGVLPHSLGAVQQGGVSDGVPLRALACVLVLDVALLCVPLFSASVFAAVVGASTCCAQIAYLIPIALRATVARKTFVRNAFHLGAWSQTVHVVSCIWLTVSSVLLLLPNQFPVTWSTFNWSPAVMSALLVLLIAYWQLVARHYVTGPPRVQLDAGGGTGAPPAVVEAVPTAESASYARL